MTFAAYAEVAQRRRCIYGSKFIPAGDSDCRRWFLSQFLSLSLSHLSEVRVLSLSLSLSLSWGWSPLFLSLSLSLSLFILRLGSSLSLSLFILRLGSSLYFIDREVIWGIVQSVEMDSDWFLVAEASQTTEKLAEINSANEITECVNLPQPWLKHFSLRTQKLCWQIKL